MAADHSSGDVGARTAKRIALIAHDQKKPVLLEWVRRNLDTLRPHRFWATGTTGGVIAEACPKLDITRLLSGPLGGDAQIGAMIAEGRLDLLVFFIDPLAAQPHDVDVKALTRLAMVHDLPVACAPATADLVIASPVFAAAHAGP
jgi:methylglyoxal synthase